MKWFLKSMASIFQQTNFFRSIKSAEFITWCDMPFNRIDSSIVRRGKRSYFNCFFYGVSTKCFILGIDFSSWCSILLLCVVKRRGTQIIKKWHFYCLHGTNFGFKWIMIFGPYYGHKNYFRNIIFKRTALSFKTILVNTYQ